MIEQTTLDGQPVTIGYFTRDFQPAEKHEADFAKVFYVDGRVVFLSLQREIPATGR
jgi:hypothetical protein